MVPQLPDLCLETIFKFIPLVDLLRLDIGLVCKSWYWSRLTVLNKRKRLRIVQYEKILKKLNYHRTHCSFETNLIEHVRRDDGTPWLTLESRDRIKFDTLLTPELTDPFVSSLMILSRITHLTLVFQAFLISTIPQLIRLIEHFSLIELKLDIFCSQDYTLTDTEGNPLPYTEDEDVYDVHPHTIEHVNNLFSCLNRIQTLRYLKLFFNLDVFHFDPRFLLLPRFTTLAFNFAQLNCVNSILSSMRHSAQDIKSIEWHQVSLKDVLRTEQQLDGKFSVLILSDCFSRPQYDDMRRLCTRFCDSLVRLELTIFRLPMAMLAQCLSQLTQLVYLELWCDLSQSFVDAQLDPEQQQQQIAQVRSVRLLGLDFYTSSHRNTSKLLIEKIFPNVQVLRLKHLDNVYECTDCKIINSADIVFLSLDRDSKAERRRKIAECKRFTREPFRTCPNLHTIAVGNPEGYRNDYTLISIDKL